MLDAETLGVAERILDDVEADGLDAVRRHAEALGDLATGDELIVERPRLERALEEVGPEVAGGLERTAERVRAFALAQRACLDPLETTTAGLRAGHRVAPVDRAGCYAPGGRYPLPSSVLMTAVTARAAGVEEVWVASPRPSEVTLAAAAVAGADALLAAGGAQAIGAFAHGAAPVPAVDVICGPGNRFVTSAKKLVSGTVAIDMLAGPSELVVLADGTGDAELAAADLLAQAEHDPDARALLVTTDAGLADAVEAALERQLADLPTAEVARASLANHGGAVLCRDLDEAVAVTDRLAPEHLELFVEDPGAVAPRLSHWGGLFLGHGACEVLGDYGAGPNHVLPTGGSARSTGGLSVFTFLRIRTFLAGDAADPDMLADAAALGRLEGLEAHARAADLRRRGAGG